MEDKKYDFTQICKERKISSEICKRNEDFLKRNPPFLRVRKIISIDSKSQFSPEFSNLKVLSFNSYSGVDGIEEKEIHKAFEFIDSLLDSLKFHKLFFSESYLLMDSPIYRNFIEDFYINSCLDLGYVPVTPKEFSISIDRTKNFNPESISDHLSEFNTNPNKWDFFSFSDLPRVFKKIYDTHVLEFPKNKGIERIGNLSLERFLEEVEMKFKGYKKQIIH